MSAPPSKSTQPTASTFNERLNEQLINCLNVQTNVIQNLAQYSQHISLQLFDIKNIVEILSNRVLLLQQQQQSHFPPNPYAASYHPNYMPPHQMPVTHPPPPSHPPSVPFPVQPPQQLPMQTRLPTSTTAPPPNISYPFFSPNPANPLHQPPPPPQTASATVPSFAFSTATSVANTLPPTTTTPTKPLFPNAPKFTAPDTTTKTTPSSSSSLFPTSKTSSTNEKPSNTTPFVFGTGNAIMSFGTGGFGSTLSNISVTKQETNADDQGEDEDEDESYEPNVSFKPIVQLSAVEVKTGEEDENVLFCERGKLYRFDPDTTQMKERGLGEMKILQHKTTNVCRVLMRREQVLKICANHQVTSQMELKPHSGSTNAFIWSAIDFADGEAKHETLCVRFKTEEQAKNFAKVFNEAKQINAKKSGDSSSSTKTSTNDQTKPKAASNDNDDDVISIGEVKPSAEQIDKAKKLQLPSTFYLYENKEPCKGCPGCEEDTPPAGSNENQTTTKKQTESGKTDSKASAPQTPSTAPVSKTPLSSSENIKFSFGNTDKSQPSLQKQTSIKEEKPSGESPAPTTPSQNETKPSIFGSFNGGSGTSIFGNTTPLNSNTTVFGSGGPGFSFPGFGGTNGGSNTPSVGFQFSTPATTSTTSTANASSTFSFGINGDKPLFGNTPKFSFADLAKQSANDKPISNGSEQRVFAGQGSLIFGTNSVNTTTTTAYNDDDDGEGGGDDESYEPNVSFKPIVQLSAVEVKTGEEDENVLFCERGKLYRFDPDTNQMKERGIGEMKILQHKTTNVCRVLMRREQVLKLCANHKITSQMELKAHAGAENAYVWSAMDFSEGETKHETFCIRFKSSEIANRFVKQFNDAKQINANAQQ